MSKGGLLSERLNKLLNCGPVQSLDCDLPGWEDNTALGEFSINIPTINITGVPNNHNWWTEDDRI
jgi:hypothetical protein